MSGASAGNGRGRGAAGPPAGVRTVVPTAPDATRVVLVRHGEAVCNVSGVIGGPRGCTGLTAHGVRQVEAMRDRLDRTGELAGAGALYSSVLPRAVATAEILAPALARWRPDGALGLTRDCGLCELHPGEADALDWRKYAETFGEPDWDRDPSTPIAPGGESWSGFVDRAASAVARIAAAHTGQLVVVACHAGVVEATMLAFMPVDRARRYRNLVRTDHASLTEWELVGGQWRLRRFNDVAPLEGVGATARPGGQESDALSRSPLAR